MQAKQIADLRARALEARNLAREKRNAALVWLLVAIVCLFIATSLRMWMDWYSLASYMGVLTFLSAARFASLFNDSKRYGRRFASASAIYRHAVYREEDKQRAAA